MRQPTARLRRCRAMVAIALCALVLGQEMAAPVLGAAAPGGPDGPMAPAREQGSAGSLTEVLPLAVTLTQVATAYIATTNQATVSVTVSAPAATAPFSYTVAVRGTTIATGTASAPVTVTATNPCSVYSVSLTATVTDALGATGNAATTLSRALCPPPPAVPHALDRIVAGATLTEASFVDRLRAMGSPALYQGAAIYRTLIAGRINPAFALGQFQAESSSGTRGYAVTTRNWGNILYHPWEDAFGAVPYAPGNGYTYAMYPDWLSSVRAYVQLLTWYNEDGYITVSSASAHWLGTIEGSARHLTYLNNITKVMSALPDDAIPVMTGLTAPAYSRGSVGLRWSARDNVLVASYQVRTRLGAGAWSAPVGTTATSQTLTLAEGLWTVGVRAIDDAGNYSAWRTIVVRVDATPPLMTKVAPGESVVRSLDGRVTVSWLASDAVGVTGYQYRVRRRLTGSWSTSSWSSATSHVFAPAPDTWYVAVRARDATGNLSAWRETRIVVPVDDRAYAFSSGTARRTSSVDYRGTYTTTARTGARLTTTFSGTGVYVIARSGPAYGRVRITIDGRSTVVDTGYYRGLRATTTRTRLIIYSTALTGGTHTLTITNLGTSGRPTFALDGIGIIR